MKPQIKQFFTTLICCLLLAAAALPGPAAAQSSPAAAANTSAAPLLGGIGWHAGGNISAVAARDNLVLYGAGPEVVILDISDPESVQRAGSLPLPDVVEDIAVQGDYAYVSAGADGLHVIDLTDSAKPALAGYLNLSDNPAEVVIVDGNTAYLGGSCAASTCSGNFSLVDISDPTHPRPISFYKSQGTIRGITLVDHFAYLRDISNRVEIIDLTDPARPVKAGEMLPANDLTIVGNYIYVAVGGCGRYGCSSGVKLMDISDPASPVEITTYELTPEFSPSRVSSDGTFLYVLGAGGFSVLDISTPDAPQELDLLELEGDLADIYLLPDRFYVASAEYFLKRNNRITVCELHDPAHPVEEIRLNALGSFQQIAGCGDFLCALSNSGLSILSIDASGEPALVGSYEFSWPSFFTVQGTTAYLVKDNSFSVIDIADPAHPALAGSYTSDIYRIHALAAAGGYAFITGSISSEEVQGSFQILDVSRPESIQKLSETELEASSDDYSRIEVSGDIVYLAGVTVEFSLLIFDVTDPSHPVPLATYEFTGDASEDRAVRDFTVEGGYAYVLDGIHTFPNDPIQPLESLTDGDFRILDIADPSQVREISLLPINATGNEILFANGSVYINLAEGGVDIYSVSNPAQPKLTAHYGPPARSTMWFTSMALLGDTVVVSDPTFGISGLHFQPGIEFYLPALFKL